MASLEHRRVLSAAEVGAYGPRPFHARIPLTAWLFVAAAVVYLAWELRPLLEPGALDPMDMPDPVIFVARNLGDASTIALPAALAFGYPAVQRRNFWLWAAAVTLAVASIAQYVLTATSEWLHQVADRFTDSLHNGAVEAGVSALDAVAWSLPLIGLGLTGVGMGMLSWGLSDAGARPSRVAVVAIAAASVGISLLSLAPLFLGTSAPTDPAELLQLGIAMLLAAATAAFSFIVALRLVIGFFSGLLPAMGWGIGAAWGTLVVALPVVALGLRFAGSAWLPELGWNFYALLFLVQSYLLFIAFARGLGRGPALRRRRFEIWA